MAPCLDGERARQLANTLLAPKMEGIIIEAHIGVDELALSDTMLRLSYDNTTVYELIDRQLAAETVAQAQRRLVRRNSSTPMRAPDDVILHLCANSVLVSRSARSPS